MLTGVKPFKENKHGSVPYGMAHQSKVANYAVASVLALFLVGAPAHLFLSQLSVVNLVSVLVIAAFLSRIRRLRFGVAGWVCVALFAVYVLCAAIAVSYSFNDENIRVLRGTLVSAASVMLGGGVIWRFKRTVIDGALISVMILAVVGCVLQMTFLFYGVGLDPAINDQFVLGESSGGLAFGLRSFFTNPNDLSVFGALCLLYFSLSRQHLWWCGATLSFLLVVLGGSRAALVVGMIVVFSVLISRPWRLLLFSLSMAGVVFGIMAIGTGEKWYVVARVEDLFQVFNSGLSVDGSLSLRYESFIYFLSHYGLFLVPSFDASLPFHAFRDASFDSGLVSRSPHNFLIELHGLFGGVGLVIFVTFGFLVLNKLGRRYGWVIASVVFVFLCFLTAVPSSFVNFHQFFFLVSLMCRSSDWAKHSEFR